MVWKSARLRKLRAIWEKKVEILAAILIPYRDRLLIKRGTLGVRPLHRWTVTGCEGCAWQGFDARDRENEQDVARLIFI